MASLKRHFILSDTKERQKFTSPKGYGSTKHPHFDTNMHGSALLESFSKVWADDKEQKKLFPEIANRKGTYIAFSSVKDVRLKLNSFERPDDGIKLLNTSFDSFSDIEKAVVFLPEEKNGYYERKITAYKTEKTICGNPKYDDFVSRIQNIVLANAYDFWVDDKSKFPSEEAIWCEIWIDAVQDSEVEHFLSLCNSCKIKHSNKIIRFPERVVTLCHVNGKDIQNLINSTGCIAEIHLFKEPASLFFKDGEDRLWTEDLSQRLRKGDLNTRICILDTGINYNNPLLKDVIEPKAVQAVDDNWDSTDRKGHGTRMAGLCEYFELESKLSSSEIIEQNIAIESVKILPDSGNNLQNLYGSITADAVNMAQAVVNDTNRIHCMAITEDTSIVEQQSKKDIGKPTSWSAALDNIIVGYEDNIKKLFVVSAGNVSLDDLNLHTYPIANYKHCVESPAQAWNALTVGAVNTKVLIEDPSLKNYKPVAQSGDLSPFSTTTNNENWGRNWPVKPEVLFEGGNAITDGHNYDYCDDTSLLTTGHKVLTKPLSTINATSAATAQASYVAAMLHREYPELWQESIRALIVHSAEWSSVMQNTFPNMSKKDGKRKLLHTFGYGVASLERAKNSYTNAATMIIQDEIQPFIKADSIKLNEMNLHKLPIPKDFLLNLGDAEIRMKVTLSYFIEAFPDERGWKSDYKYASCGLRFEVKNFSENKREFLQRINKAVRDDDYVSGENQSNSDRWFLGSLNRDVGSIHSDYWVGRAADLADSEYLAVFPVTGWWKTRKRLNRYNDKIRYSLIVSLDTKTEADIYSAIQIEIANTVPVQVTV